jgi:hypothetical protein
MNIVLWVLQVLLAVAMFLHGYVYVVWPASLVAKARQRRPDKARPELNPNFRRFIGLAECAAALGLILPGLTGILPWLTPLAAVGLIAVMGSAIVYHFQTGDRKGATGPLVMLVLALVVAYGRLAVARL